jgi:hypothetical protein
MQVRFGGAGLMSNDKKLIIWTVEWEERLRPGCGTCCNDENHPWKERREVFTTNNAALNQENYLYEQNQKSESSWQYANIKTYTGEVALQETYLVRVSESTSRRLR